MHLKVFTKCQMLCNAYDDMSGFSILNTRGVTAALLGAGARSLDGVVSARLVKAADHGAEDPPLSLNSSGWLGAAAAEGQQRARRAVCGEWACADDRSRAMILYLGNTKS